MCDPDDPRVIGSGFCFFVVVLPTIIMIAVSFEALGANDLGVQTNKHYGYVTSSKVWTTGNHYVGLWHTFSVRSKLQKNKDYSITAYTNNIIKVAIDISIQYQIDISTGAYQTLYDLLFGFDSANDYFDAKVVDALRRGVQSLESEILYNSRGLVTTVLRDNVDNAIKEIGFILSNLQLVDLTVPDEMQDAIDMLVSATQDIGLAENNREKLVVAAENEKAQNIHDAEVAALEQVKTAEAEYNATLVTLDADFYALAKEIEIIELTIINYQSNFPEAIDRQIMEMFKADRWSDIVSQAGNVGNNKVFLDHKPSAMGQYADYMVERLQLDSNGTSSYVPTTPEEVVTTTMDATTTTETAEDTTTTSG